MTDKNLRLIRFHGLKERGIAGSYTQLSHLVRSCGFPEGRMLSARTRVWTVQEVEDWLSTRPPYSAAKPELIGGAKMVAEGRPLKRRSSAQERS